MADFVEDEQPSRPRKTPRTHQSKINKKELKKELRILIECLGFGHGRYQKFPQYQIQNSSELKARINELIDLISK